MSSLTAVKPYDRVFDAQKHYRTLLECTARPGTIGQLDDMPLKIPVPLNRATAWIALALFSTDCSFYVQEEGAVAEFLRRETLAKPAAIEQAEFLLLTDANQFHDLSRASIGTLPYPDLGATVVLAVTAISVAPIPGSLRLLLRGPGIEKEATVFVVGAPEELFVLLANHNAEFPLGVDTYLTCDSLSAGPCVLALPRSTHVQWNRI